MNSKIEAIRYLENAMKHNPAYKDKWRDYIEIHTIEELAKTSLPVFKQMKLAAAIAENILRMFDATWWEMADNTKNKQNEK